MNGTDGGRQDGCRPHVLLFGVGILALAVLAMACHPQFGHIDGIESQDDVENACVNWDVVKGPPPAGIDFASARATIAGILNDNRGWESASSKIDFVVNSSDCDQLGQNHRAEQEIEYRIGNVFDYGPCSSPCLVFDATTQEQHGEWRDFTKARIYLTYPDLRDNSDNLVKHVINHETGHAVGLGDVIEPLIGAPCAGHPCCVVNYYGQYVWNVSIMHNRFQCEDFVRQFGSPIPARNLPWPSLFDINFARWITTQ